MSRADRSGLRLLPLAVGREWICGGCATPHRSEAGMEACAAADLDALTAAAVAYVDSTRRSREQARLCWNCGAAPHPVAATVPPAPGPNTAAPRPPRPGP